MIAWRRCRAAADDPGGPRKENQIRECRTILNFLAVPSLLDEYLERAAAG